MPISFEIPRFSPVQSGSVLTPQFQGRLVVESKGFDDVVMKMPGVGPACADLKRYIEEETPKDTTVFFSVHSTRKNKARLNNNQLPGFTRSAVGAKSVADLEFNLKVKGDPTLHCFGIYGPLWGSAVEDIKKHIARVLTLPKPKLTPWQKESQDLHDVPYSQVKAVLAKQEKAKKVKGPSKTISTRAGKHLRSRRYRVTKPLAGFVLRQIPASRHKVGSTQRGTHVLQPDQSMLSQAGLFLKTLAASNPARSLAGFILRQGRQDVA